MQYERRGLKKTESDRLGKKKNFSILIKFLLMQYDKNGKIGRLITKKKPTVC